MMNIMVTGAAGGYGSYAIQYLREFAPDANIYALVKDESKGRVLKEQGVNIRIGDYNNYNSMVTALEGIDRLLFVSVSTPGVQKNVVEAAMVNGIKYIAYTSLCGIEYSKFGLEINHRQTEEWIKQSGIQYTFLRNNWYLELMSDYLSTATGNGKFSYFASKGKIAWALKREYAEAGARVIASGNVEPILNLAGKPVSYRELAEAAEQAFGKVLSIQEVPKGTFPNILKQSGISQMGMMLATSYQDYALAGDNGESELNVDDFEKVLGHPLTPLADAIKELIGSK